MNDQLRDIYSSKWEQLSAELKKIVASKEEIKPTHPLLLSIKNEAEFLSADIRVMIFGQETNDWEGVFGSRSIDDLLDVYRGFFRLPNPYGRPFWECLALFKKMLDEKYSGKKIAYLWNNIIKIGKAGEIGKPPDYIYHIERKYFSVIESEVEIIKPHIVLFLTGPDYDDEIRDNFPTATGDGGNPTAKLSISGIRFAFRTYHPAYLRRIEKTKEVFEEIIKAIKI